ncbi:MAG TPA: ADP-forming succinate--CoA ligase subunit beta [Candidatus Dormibacteraeota bacterium]|jgi:succinyl-CoA synthetase beta subunit|nr:ADP-forming succinate--CoA ligase subunit beta [Candidatus Dormibacteraeota bacterium]
MKLLEYQAKEQFREAGIPVKDGRLARTPEQAADAAAVLGPIAVKAQVQTGGRGKAGGIKLAPTPEEARAAAAAILGMDIKGYTVHEVWCEQAAEVAREIYLGVTLDRDARRLVIILSAAGGMDIEEVAETAPEKIVKFHPDPWRGAQAYELRAICFQAGLGDLVGKLVPIMQKLYALALRTDALTCEINPLAVVADGSVIALDGKLETDENAEFRHPELERYRSDEAGSGDPLEIEAHKRGITYVHLDGDVGVLGNGAGLVMNTLDLVRAAGGRPANFLDIGGGAKAEVVRNSLEMILLDPGVKSIFINIFGGITRGDEVARGVVAARDELDIKVPLVVRMTGTAEEEGRRILEENGITPGIDASAAAAKAVELAAAGGRS